MQEKPSLLPPFSGAEDTLLSASQFGEERGRAPADLRFSVAGRRSSKSFWGALALATLAGGALGLALGSRAGGLSEATRGRLADTAPLGASGVDEVARLREDVRSLRAQVEQIRHIVETSRTAERLKALETAHEASAAHTQLAASTATKLDALEARLERLERVGVDMTPTNTVQRPAANNGRKTAAP